MAKDDQAVVPGNFSDSHIGLAGCPEGDDLEGGRAGLEKISRSVGAVVVQLVNNVDSLRGGTQLLHEGIVSGHVVRVHSGTVDQIVELDSEEDLSFLAQLSPELTGHRPEVLFLAESLAKKLPQFRVDGLRVVVAEETKAGINFFLKEFPVDSGETGQNFDEERKEVGALCHGAWSAQGPTQE